MFRKLTFLTVAALALAAAPATQAQPPAFAPVPGWGHGRIDYDYEVLYRSRFGWRWTNYGTFEHRAAADRAAAELRARGYVVTVKALADRHRG